jgi:hypothetical protein
VKCDETLPSCQRCVKWQGYCSGYKQPASMAGSRDNERSSDGEDSQSSPTAQLVIQPNPLSGGYRSVEDKLYFSSWLELAPTLPGNNLDSETWVRIIPQLSHQQAAVKWAAMAVGAMKMAIGTTIPPPSATNQAIASFNNIHYEHALHYYGNAVGHVGSATTATGIDTVRGAILASLLLACYECIQGHSDGAKIHIHHGASMIEEYFPSVEKLDSVNSICSVIWTYRLLSEQSWLYLSVFPLSGGDKGYELWRVGSLQSVVPSPMAQFSTLEEASKSWLLTRQYVMDFSRLNMVELLHDTLLSKYRGVNLELQQRYLDCLEHWYTAFRPLYSVLVNSTAMPEPTLQAISLKLSYLLAYTFTKCPILSNFEDMKSLTSTFREIIDLSGILLGDTKSSFTMDYVPTWGLLVILLRCRDRNVRLDAAKLLRKHTRRDGLWDSRLANNLGVRCSEVMPAETVNDSRNVVKARVYRQDVRAGNWVFREILLRIEEETPFTNELWSHQHQFGPYTTDYQSGNNMRTLVGIELPPMPPTTGRWLLYESSR